MDIKNKYLKILFSFSWIIFFIPIVIIIILNNKININNQILYLTVFVSLLIIFVICLVNMIKKNWAAGISGFIIFILSIIIMTIWFVLMFLFGLVFPADENFTDNLTIPENIEISEPGEWDKNIFEDTFTKEIITELKKEGNKDSTVKGTIQHLSNNPSYNKSRLINYFAASPYWRLTKKDGSFTAVRRMTYNGNLKFSLHGYYTKHDLTEYNNDIPYFQIRTKIGSNYKKKSFFSDNTTFIKNYESKNVKLTTGNNSNESNVVILYDDFYLEIFEQSKYKERIATKRIISLVNSELDKLKNENIIKDKPIVKLHNSYQPGIYDSEIWINPGEPGYIYLKAYEITKNTPLSVSRIKDKTIEYTGWSTNSEELFYSNSNFTIYEGVWGKPYAARFEVWFVPEKGGPEKKLLEKNYKIEGWMR